MRFCQSYIHVNRLIGLASACHEALKRDHPPNGTARRRHLKRQSRRCSLISVEPHLEVELWAEDPKSRTFSFTVLSADSSYLSLKQLLPLNALDTNCLTLLLPVPPPATFRQYIRMFLATCKNFDRKCIIRYHCSKSCQKAEVNKVRQTRRGSSQDLGLGTRSVADDVLQHDRLTETYHQGVQPECSTGLQSVIPLFNDGRPRL